MSEAVHGSDVVLEMNIDGQFYPVLCGTDCEFSCSPEFLEKTANDTATSKRWRKRIEEFSASVSGLTKLPNTESLSFFYMLQSSVRRSVQEFRHTFTDDTGASNILLYSAHIGQQSINGPVGDFANARIELKIDGDITIEEVAPPVTGEYDVLADWWSAVAGQNYISGNSSGNTDGTAYALLSTDIIMHVEVENQIMYKKVGTPGVGDPWYDFITSPSIKLETSLTFGGGEKVFVMWKRLIP